MSEDRRSPTTASEALPRDPAPLDPASPLDLPLHAGESQAFAVVLAEDHFLDLRVDQHGVDVAVTLFGPTGEPLLEVDNPSGADGARGSERLVWVAEAPGTHTVAVRARARQTTGQSSAGGGQVEGSAGGGQVEVSAVTIELAVPRVAEPGDRHRAVAEQAKAEADSLYGQGDRASRRRAIVGYQRALIGFQALNEAPRQADARYRLGKSWLALGDKQRAFGELEAALQLYRAAGNEPQQAQCRQELCHLLVTRRELEPALEHCQAALDLWSAAGDRLGLARTAHELGYVHRLLNEGHRALELYDRALELWRRLSRARELAQTLHNRGRLYAALGRRGQALADLEGALAIRRRHGEERDVALSLNSLGLLHARRQDMEQASAYFTEALTLREAMGERRAGISLTGLGWAHFEVDGARSAEYFQQALEIFRRQGSKIWEAQALLLLGRQAGALDRPVRVPEPLTAALELFEAGRDLAGAAETRLAIAGNLRRLGRLSAAQVEVEHALEMVEDLRTRAAASLGQRAYFLATKQAYYELYVDLLMDRHAGRPSAGFDALALEASERARARSLIDALSEHDGGLRRDADPALREEERRLQRQIGSRQVLIETLLADEHQDRVARQRDEQRDLLRRHDKLQGQIRLRSPRYAELTRPPLASVADIQRLIGPETLLLEYRLGESRSFLWAVTSEALTAFELPPRSQVEKAARFATSFISRERQESATRSKRRARQVLADLSRWLLADVRGQLASARRLLIVADGALHYLPFEALDLAAGDSADLEPVRPLVAELDEIVYLPSASTLAVLRRRLADRQPAPRLLAVLADPVFTPADPRLPQSAGAGRPSGEGQTEHDPGAHAPVRSGGHSSVTTESGRLIHTAREAEAILALVPAANPLAALGFEANRDLLTSCELGRRRIVHLATHGELNAEHAELSRLALSLFDAQGRPRQDGSLYAYEVYGLELPAELVVLSACQTALGEHIRGEGLVGLTRGFMHAGAARVVVSLWRVEDQATAALMELFYRNLLLTKMAPAAALRAAKDSIRQKASWQDPYYWAGFVFQGEWKDFQAF